ncbi:MAG: hypothetical protein U0350_36945 [Caldilineaceae bacterium]
MQHNIDTLLTELRTTIAELGKGGGSISPSVYDTAQVLRLFPPEDPEPAFQWLLAQQKADGGWGSPETPYARDAPTLAAVLALRTYRQTPTSQEAVDAGLRFLQQGVDQWRDAPIDALPIAAEMVLPYLLEDAKAVGLVLNTTPYASLYRLRSYKKQQINQRSLQSGTPPTHSWETLDQSVESILPDQSGGIGHSPAATAAWLQQAVKNPDLEEPCKRARRYLTQAAAATGVNISGVVPNVWPITGFELAYAPYALLATGLLHHPTLCAAIEPIMDELWVIMQRGHGVSFGEYFTPDGDDTGLALGVLKATSREVDPAFVLQFKNGDHFYTFHHELNPSVFANAHALYGLAYAGRRYPATEHFLLERQSADGRWLADKLHSSWLYTTLEVVLVLNHLGYSQELKKAAYALVQQQKADGGWGNGQSSTRAETSYALITLSTLQQRGLLSPAGLTALQRGYQMLHQGYRPSMALDEALWLGKELYAPRRVDRVYVLSALLSVAVERISV